MKTAILLIIGLCLVRCNVLPNPKPPVEYESDWAVHLHEGVDPQKMQDLGFEILGQVSTLKDTYLLRHTETHARHLRSNAHKFMPSSDVTETLTNHPHVKWADQQFLTKHTKYAITDPLFTSQWHLKNTGQFSGLAGVDANIQGAWDLGFHGEGVRIAVVDDGYQTTHPELAPRYQAASSFNFNNDIGSGTSPNPDTTTDFHGTAAGGVALAANNSVCGVGAAYMAEGSGIRMISQGVTDATMASGLIYRNQLNNIYTNSWGVLDDGINVGGPGTTSRNALASGVATGRGGLGNVYLWSAGNGLLQNDNCNYNGWTTTRESIAVGAIGNDGKQAYYSEPCAAMLITGPSSSANANAGIRTSDLVDAPGYDVTSCTSTFGGTSSSCPLVAGITALILQANPTLTWRDVPVILARTAVKNDPTDTDWKTNGAGFHVNHKYGFGMVDATAAVTLALNFTKLAAQQTLTSNTVTVNQAIPDYPNVAGVSSTFTIATGITVEKVLINIRINHATSGDLQIVLTSPAGTESYMSTPHAFTESVVYGTTTLAMGGANYGAQLTFAAPITGNVLRANPVVACTAITNCADLAGKIAIVNSGTCNSIVKAKLIQGCGAKAVIVANVDTTNPDTILNLSGVDATVNISTFSASYNTGVGLTTQAVTIKYSQYAANNYVNGWQMASVRLLGESSAGTWTVKVTDGVPGNTGTFTSYAVSIYGSNTQTAATASGAASTTSSPAASTSASATASPGVSSTSDPATPTSSPASALQISFVVLVALVGTLLI